jgi:small conductance mechanosensitive channel
MELSINISYSDSLDTAFAVLRGIIANETRFLQEPAAQVVLHNLQDGSVTMIIRAWATSDVYWDIYWYQMRNIKEKIEEAGLRIPYPQREVRIIKDKEEEPAG